MTTGQPPTSCEVGWGSVCRLSEGGKGEGKGRKEGRETYGDFLERLSVGTDDLRPISTVSTSVSLVPKRGEPAKEGRGRKKTPDAPN